ncbi:MAG: hypothetical protein LUG26_01610, partial [Ruminococcus sp.]|nr:hypothetical protein [Ruminococcus sp.]
GLYLKFSRMCSTCTCNFRNFNNLSSDDQNAIELAFNAKTEFNNGECTVGEYLDKINGIDDAISGLDEDTQAEIKLLLNDDDITTKIDDFDDKISEAGFLDLCYDEIVEAEELEEKRKDVLDNLWNSNKASGYNIKSETEKELEEELVSSLSEEDLEIACKVVTSTDIESVTELMAAIKNYDSSEFELEEKISFSNLMAEEDSGT